MPPTLSGSSNGSFSAALANATRGQCTLAFTSEVVTGVTRERYWETAEGSCVTTSALELKLSSVVVSRRALVLDGGRSDRLRGRFRN